MKKVVFSLMIFLGGFLFSQDYNDTYPNYYGYEYYDDSNNYPDDYYYNYPTDYYPTDYYQSYYNDYNRSISNVNWNRFFSEYRLNNWQMNEIMMLNNRFSSYYSWNTYYGMNPDRWYYDRFYALERILGPQVFAIYQQRYYQNYSPIVYFQNYRNSYYVVHYKAIPKYRYVNVNRYKVYRNDFKNSYQSTRNMVMLDTRASTPIRSGENGNNRNQGMMTNNQTVRDTRIGNVRASTSTSTVNQPIRSTGNNRAVGVDRSSSSAAQNERSTVRSSNSGAQQNTRSNATRSSSSVSSDRSGGSTSRGR